VQAISVTITHGQMTEFCVGIGWLGRALMPKAQFQSLIIGAALATAKLAASGVTRQIIVSVHAPRSYNNIIDQQ